MTIGDIVRPTSLVCPLGVRVPTLTLGGVYPRGGLLRTMPVRLSWARPYPEKQLCGLTKYADRDLEPEGCAGEGNVLGQSKCCRSSICAALLRLSLREDLPDCVRNRTDTRQEKCSTFEEPGRCSLKPSGSDWLCRFRFSIWGRPFLTCSRGRLRSGIIVSFCSTH